MAKKTKILVVDSDLHALSRLYLSLLHKNYGVEAANEVGEVRQRIERFKPKLLIIHAALAELDATLYDWLSKRRLQVFILADGEPAARALPGSSFRVFPAAIDLNELEQQIREELQLLD